MQSHRFFCIFLLVVLFSSCRKDLEVSSDPALKLEFSTDTVLFDTVFSTIGSATKRFKIYNRNSSAIVVSRIQIDNSAFASYRLNVDGYSGTSIEGVEIPANDSVFAFVELTINEKPNENFPFIISAPINFLTNGNAQKVEIEAFGQNANFIVDSIISGNVVWDKTLPYVVYGGFLVDSLSTLNIDAGVNIYMHRDAIILAKGTIRFNGTSDDTITVQGDRREPIYYNEPGQWNSIQFLPGSLNNLIQYTTIKGSIFGVVAGTFPEYGIPPELTIQNSIIKYSQVTGIYAINSKIKAYNNLIFACGQYGLLAQFGGEHEFIHNTFALTNNFVNRESPAVALTDYIVVNNLEVPKIANIVFQNNIVWGTSRDEMFSKLNLPSQSILTIENNLMRSSKSWPLGNQLNTDPMFANPSLSLAFNETEDYRLKTNSPAKAKAPLRSSPAILLQDMDGVNRSNPCSYGCFE